MFKILNVALHILYLPNLTVQSIAIGKALIDVEMVNFSMHGLLACILLDFSFDEKFVYSTMQHNYNLAYFMY